MSKIVIILFIVSTIFLTFNIQGQDFSLDEPDTISIAASIGKSVIPDAWDGTNFSPIEPHIFTVRGDRYIWSWHPWFQHYVAYIGTLIFGRDSPLVRIPFALFGSLTIVMTYLVGMKVYNNRLSSTLTAIHLMLLLPFFLYMRQVRYYSIGAFLSVFIFWLVIDLIKGKTVNTGYKLILAIALISLFITNYVIWVSTITILVLIALYKRMFSVLIPLLVSVLFAVMWYLILKPFHGNIGYNGIDIQMAIRSVITYKNYIAEYIFPIILFFPLILIARRYRKFMPLVSVWIAIKICIDSVFLVPHGRYIVDLFPMFVILIGFLYDYLVRKKKAYIAIFVLMLIVSSNLVHSLPTLLFGSRTVIWRNWLSAYYSEFTFRSPFFMPQIASYIKKRYKPGDLFWSNEYKLHIYNHAGVPHLSAICDPTKKKLVGPDKVTDITKVKWFIFFQNDTRFPQSLEMLCGGKAWQDYLVNNYTPHTIFLKDRTAKLNDPDIVNRQFPPYEIGRESVIIYEKKLFKP